VLHVSNLFTIKNYSRLIFLQRSVTLSHRNEKAGAAAGGDAKKKGAGVAAGARGIRSGRRAGLPPPVRF
jgi:hypothetical protein